MFWQLVSVTNVSQCLVHFSLSNKISVEPACEPITQVDFSFPQNMIQREKREVWSWKIKKRANWCGRDMQGKETREKNGADWWGLLMGIKLARALSLNSVILKLDSHVVTTLLRRHSCLWGSKCAELMANLEHSSPFTWTVADNPPPFLNLLLQKIALGVVCLVVLCLLVFVPY